MSYAHVGAPTTFNGTNPETGGDSSKSPFHPKAGYAEKFISNGELKPMVYSW